MANTSQMPHVVREGTAAEGVITLSLRNMYGPEVRVETHDDVTAPVLDTTGQNLLTHGSVSTSIDMDTSTYTVDGQTPDLDRNDKDRLDPITICVPPGTNLDIAACRRVIVVGSAGFVKARIGGGEFLQAGGTEVVSTPKGLVRGVTHLGTCHGIDAEVVAGFVMANVRHGSVRVSARAASQAVISGDFSVAVIRSSTTAATVLSGTGLTLAAFATHMGMLQIDGKFKKEWVARDESSLFSRNGEALASSFGNEIRALERAARVLEHDLENAPH